MSFNKCLDSWAEVKTFLRCAALLVACSLIIQHANAQTADRYKLGPEDVITVTVLGHPEFSAEFFVPADGHIDIPVVGQILVTGKTLADLSNLVKTGLKDRLLDPEVSVALKTPRVQRVYVLGAVAKPGLYDLKPGWRITEAVSASGGIQSSTEVSDCKAIVLRAETGAREVVALSEALSGTTESNLILNAGDVLTIQPVETIPIYVMGKVKNPGLYNIRVSSAGVEEAVTLAGGVSEDANLSKVSVTHLDGVTEVVDMVSTMITGKTGSASSLKSGDLVVVPESTSKVAVLGFVGTPGFYQLKEGQTVTLSDILGMAKGTDNKRGGMNSVTIIRTEDSVQKRLVYDFQKFLRTGDSTQNPIVKSGDVVFVPETRSPDKEMIFRALSTVGILINPFMK